MATLGILFSAFGLKAITNEPQGSGGLACTDAHVITILVY
jgi:hypothetical protein